LIPILLPFFSPLKLKATGNADLGGKAIFCLGDSARFHLPPLQGLTLIIGINESRVDLAVIADKAYLLKFVRFFD
jgi:hypothetical protein